MAARGRKQRRVLQNSPMADKSSGFEPGAKEFTFFPRLILVLAALLILGIGCKFVFF